MFKANETKVTTFLLLGFQNLNVTNHFLFVLFLLIYVLTLFGNLLIIILVIKVQSLRSPMYFFLAQLSFSDILHTTNITPNMLHGIINGGSTISVTGCITQLYFYGTSTGAECLLLTVMSYDRYLAICRPLHYISIMNLRLQVQLVLWLWILAFMAMIIIVIFMSNLEFCGLRTIDHYLCDFAPILRLSCSDYSFLQLIDLAFGFFFVLFPFLFIIFTYVAIFVIIFGISCKTGKKKAFSTCSSHLIVVSTYYGTLIIVYMAPSEGQSFNYNKVISLLYTIGTPLLNPIIYSLRNRDIKKALITFLSNVSIK